MYSALEEQMRQHELQRDAEIVYLRDSGEQSIGSKRNALLHLAKGAFVSFVDDDDQIGPDYLPLVCEAIRRRPNVDCLGIRGVISFRGSHPREFVHSLRYREIFSRKHAYYRPPAHLNPIRREITLRYPFADISYSEDFDWALRLRDDGALKQEEFIDSPICYYLSRRWWPYQWILDHTEIVRHRLGLMMVDRLRKRGPTIRAMQDRAEHARG